MKPILLAGLALLAVAPTALGCHRGSSSTETDASGSADGGRSDGSLGPDGAVATDLQIAPFAPSVVVEPGLPLPQVQFTATSGGVSVSATFTVDRADLGSLSASGQFTASGEGAGPGVVTARWGGLTASTPITVQLHVQQNGASPDGGTAADAGAGGWGGVGGEGMGGPVLPETATALAGPPTADPGLKLLYPYEGTVWPKGVLAPLMQWQSQTDYDAVSIELTGSTFRYAGTFARTATPFTHHPIPPTAWRQLNDACAGETIAVRLVFASGGAAYGPLEAHWKIASGSLKGTVYYNSYGTRLAKNSSGALGPDPMFGGATLAITGGALEPVLVAGGNGDAKNCRVCHVVAADGSRLVTQHGDNYSVSSAYDLKSPVQEAVLPGRDWSFAWGAVSPDGALLFSNAAPLSGASNTSSSLFALPSGSAVATSGLPAGLRAGTPAFAPNGKSVAFNWYGGTVASQRGDTRSLAVMDFAPPGSFTGFRKVYTPADPNQRAVYPGFTPDSGGLIFELELVSNGRGFAETRSTCDSGACANRGARGELWWLDLKSLTTTRLDQLNGAGYAPPGPNGHDDDATLNYEPTVGPVPSGGYVWVVFTSRRLYGNIATINPFWSDPRYQNISSAPTPKKLWVAAIDLDATPGTDPSHPAFYVPAQELLAGNSGGYWVSEVCREVGNSCESGDQCCTGYCRLTSSEGGAMACTEKPLGCAHEYESCQQAADCCADERTTCVGGHCVRSGPN
jgi:hypothetical protein